MLFKQELESFSCAFILSFDDMLSRILQWCFVLTLAYSALGADAAPVRFARLDSGDGLSADWIRCVYQDTRGMIWIGTSFGLDRYDGNEVKTFRLEGENGSDLNTPINVILSGGENTFLVGTDSGLFTFDLVEEAFAPVPEGTTRPVLDLLRDSRSRVWVCTDHGVARLGEEGGRGLYLSGEDGTTRSYANAVFEDASGRIWVGTKDGVGRYDEERDRFRLFWQGEESSGLAGLDVLDIEEDRQGGIWLAAAANGLLSFDGKREDGYEVERFHTGKSIRLKIDSRGTLWVAQGGAGGLLRADLNAYAETGRLAIETLRNDPLVDTSLSGDSLFSLFEDREGGLWVGTFGKGLNYASRFAKPFKSITKGPDPSRSIQEEMVNCLFEEDDYLWIGTNGGLERMDKRDGTFTRFRNEVGDPESLGADAIFAVYKDSRDNLWVGGWTSGLNRFDYETERFERFLPSDDPGSISSSIIFDIMEDSQGNLWIGTLGGGLNRFDYETERFEVYRHDPDDETTLGMDDVNRVIESSDGYLYVAASRSFVRFDRESDTFKRYDHSESADNGSSGGYVVNLHEDRAGNLWLATRAGLELFHRDSERFTVFGMEDGLPSPIIAGLLDDARGNLWVSTADGISIFEGAVRDPQRARFRSVSRLDGIAGGQFNQRAELEGQDGTFYFGSSAGVSYIRPEDIVFNETEPPMAFTDFLLLERSEGSVLGYRSLGESIDHRESLVLGYDDASFMIKYAALNYLNPERNRYRYRLAGHGKNWVDAGSANSVTYSQLPPGKYEFQVIGSNNDGVWASEAKRLAIVVTPPWWQTMWARLGGLLLLVLIFVIVYRIRFAFVRKNQRLLEGKVAERTASLQELNSLLAERQEEIEAQNKELQRHRDKLEEIVAERTRELMAEKLRAEEADRLKSSFLMNMSHEIRTPMNAIIGFSSLLRAMQVNEEEKNQFLDSINKNGRDLLVLIDEILDISLIEADQVKLYPEIFDVVECLEERVEYYRIKNEKNIEFKIERFGDGDTILINADPVRFRELVNNLLNNAYKFTENGEIVLRYGVVGERIRVEVQDTGIGIDLKDQEKVFSHFYKVERSRSKLYRGTGIGLSICSKIINKMGGAIQLESELGVGSRFWFELPQGDIDQPIDADTEKAEVSMDLSDFTVIVAEDDDMNADVISYALNGTGAGLVRAQDGQKALDLVEQNKERLESLVVLMDIKMPVMGGEEACFRLRRLYPKLPIIAVTAYAQDAERKRISKSGFNRILTKPIATENLAREILDTVSRR